ncbi:MAG: 2,3-bisphosphoglycerate-independent phosphoglycerate mutase [Calditrichota bacterium]
MKPELLSELITTNDSKIIFMVMDGLGGHPMNGNLCELEAAETPNLDRFAAEGITGMLDPVAPGITPGSGPGHLALFGYDPLENIIGRGVLSALGIDFTLTGRDVACRLNFCTMDENGIVLDRRAGRIATKINEKMCDILRENVSLGDEVEFFLQTVSEHRAVLVLRGDGLGGDINDTDPQKTGLAPREAKGGDAASEKTVKYINSFLQQTSELLKNESPANMVLARGFAAFDPLPTMQERYGLRAAAVAQYPMYRGLARLVGMEVFPRPDDYSAMLQQIKDNYDDYDFFFVHFKKTDSSGEDGDYEKKVKVIEEIDAWCGQLRELSPTVLAVTGDHSTPSKFSAHSWHPVPALLWSENCRPDRVTEFGENACLGGAIGRMATKHLMMLCMANAMRLNKFGA